MEYRVDQLESEILKIEERIQNAVVKKVATMLTDNIFDLIPGYQQLTETVHHKLTVRVDEVLKQQKQLKEYVDEYMRQRFGPLFVQKIETTIKQVTQTQYDIQVLKLNSVQKKDFKLLEEKLNLYAPLVKHQELEKRSEKYALQTELDKNSEGLKSMEKAMLVYTLQTEFNIELEKFRDEFQAKIDGKISKEVFLSKFANVEEGQTTLHRKIQTSLSNTVSDRKDLQDFTQKFASQLNEVKEDLLKKISIEEVRQIWANFSKYAVYADLKDLYQRCLPKIAAFEQRILDFDSQIEKMNQVILRFDEVIVEKSNKSQLEQFKQQVIADYVPREQITQIQNELAKFQTTSSEKVDYLEEIVKNQTMTFERQMFSNIRREIAKSKEKSQNTQQEAAPITAELAELLKSKADQDKVSHLEQMKANKADTEICLRWIDLLHKMIKQIVQIYQIQLKNEIDLTGCESQNQLHNRKFQLFHQVQIIKNWVESFDAQNVNDFFIINDQYRSELVQAQKSTLQFKNSYSDFDKIQLSPNQKDVNDPLSKTRYNSNKQSQLKLFSQRANSTVVAPVVADQNQKTVGGSRTNSFAKTFDMKNQGFKIQPGHVSRAANHSHVLNKINTDPLTVKYTKSPHLNSNTQFISTPPSTQNIHVSSMDKPAFELQIDLQTQNGDQQNIASPSSNYSNADRLNFPVINPFYKNI